MNIYECRFVDENDKVTRVRQYGNSEEEIDVFWREWWPKHYNGLNPSVGKYVDCFLFAEDVIDYDDNILRLKKEIVGMEKTVFVNENGKDK